MPDYTLMNQCLYEGKAKEVEQMVAGALAEGRSAQEILTEGLIAGMNVVGEDFKHNILYVPEVLIAARAMKAGMAALKPLLGSKEAGVKPAGILVVGTVRGDLHDIGKNIVAMMLRGAGYEVVDLGADVPKEKFLAQVKKENADVVAMSALLTTTMTYMPEIITGLETAKLRSKVKVIIGGAPVSQAYADRIKADGYAPDAALAVDLLKRLSRK